MCRKCLYSAVIFNSKLNYSPTKIKPRKPATNNERLLNEAEYHLNMEIEEGLEISTRVFIKRQTSHQSWQFLNEEINKYKQNNGKRKVVYFRLEVMNSKQQQKQRKKMDHMVQMDVFSLPWTRSKTFLFYFINETWVEECRKLIP